MDREAIIAIIVEQTRELLPHLENHAFSGADSLRDLGADSMDRADILMMTLESVDLNVPAVTFHGAKNIGDLAEQIHAQLKAR